MKRPYDVCAIYHRFLNYDEEMNFLEKLRTVFPSAFISLRTQNEIYYRLETIMIDDATMDRNDIKKTPTSAARK
jgi:hypothetical protein